tara:strand:- start:677 stop:1132 length:456 start_codon:yes stop_codon:yes gene_type:complete
LKDEDDNGHVLFSRFGARQRNKRTEIDKLLESVKKIDSISAQILLREAYEVSYEIVNREEDPYHPWEMVLERHKENYTLYGTLYRTIYSYRLRDINKRFGLNLAEFLDLPREFVELIFEICHKEDETGQETLQNLAEELEETSGLVTQKKT